MQSIRIVNTLQHAVPRRWLAVASMLLLSLAAAVPGYGLAPAALTNPVPGSTLSGSSVTFTWSTGAGVSQYSLSIGSNAGGTDVYPVNEGTATMANVTTLPLDGRTLYVSLGSLIGSAWSYASYTLIAATTGPTCAGLSLGQGASLNGFVPFSASSPWNQNISSAPVDPNSLAIINFIGPSVALHPDFGSGLYQGATIGIPYVVVDSNQPLINVTGANGWGEGDPAPSPIPANAPIEGYPNPGDQHVLVLQRGGCWLYELYSASVDTSGNWTSQVEAIWDLLGNEQRPYTWTSADAAGLPIFAGLVRYDEVAAGAIDHALRFTLKNSQAAFIPPASHWAANSTNALAAPMGMRLRLQASFDVSGFSPANQVILNALKQYGMIMADNGSSMYLTGAPDPRWDNNDLSVLKTLTAANFEVIAMTPVYTSSNVPQGPLPVVGSFGASASGVASGTPVTLTWNVSGASYSFVSPAVGAVRGISAVVTPAQTTTYTLYANNQYGRTTATVTVTVNNAATTTMLAASPNPALAGQAVTLTATVGSTGGTVPNGEIVTFASTGQALGTAPLSGGVATLTTSVLSQGTDTVTASYPGDANFGASSGSTVETINASSQATTTTVLTASPNPSTFGQAVTLKATVGSSSGTVPNGEVVTFTMGAQALGTAVLSAGVASLKVSALPSGSDTVTAAYAGDANFGASSGSVLATVKVAATVTAFTASPNPSTVGQAVTLTATISSTGGTVPNGEVVAFKMDGATLGTASLSAGTASLTLSNLPSKSHDITASYAGDANFGASSHTLLVTVNAPATTTTTVLTASPNPALAGQAVTLTATVGSTSGTVPNGEVISFNFGSQTLGTAPLVNGVASLTTSALPRGSDSVTAAYPGDANFGASSGSFVETVTPASTTSALSASPNPTTFGQAVTLTATVSSAGGTIPNGEVITFKLGSQTLGTAALSGGTASLTVSNLSVGSDTVTASYPGDANSGASSGSFVETVNPANTTTALSPSPNPSTFGQAVTLTATVSSAGGTIPNGEVITLKLGSQTLGTAALSGGIANLTLSNLPVGSDTVTASYPGDANFVASSASFVGTVNPASTSTVLSGSPNPATLGQTVTLSATVNSTGGTVPNGEAVTFQFGSQTLGTAILAGGVASLSVSNLPQGSDTVTASYPGDANFGASSASLAETVNLANQATTTTVLSASPNPATFGQAVTLKATVSSTGGAVTNGEVVTFQLGSQTLGAVALSGGSASLSVSNLPPGSDAVTASYPGDTKFGPSSGSVVATVKVAATVTAFTASPNPSTVGQAVVLTATVSSTGGTVPNGEVVGFKMDGATLGTATLSASVASLTLSNLPLKSHDITASYAGDANFGPSSHTLLVTVNVAATTTTLTASPNPGAAGQPVMLTATVSSMGGTIPNREVVNFMLGSQSLGTALLSGGVASLTVSNLPSGSDTVTASYPGDANFAAGSGSTVETVH